MTRDSVVWLFGIAASVVVGLASNLHLFPWLSETAQHGISLAAFVVGLLSAAMTTSPLKHSEENLMEKVGRIKADEFDR